VETVPNGPRQEPPGDAHDGHRPGHEHGADDTWWHRLQDWVIGVLGGVHPHEDEGDGHGGGLEPVTITDFGEQTELLVEFPPLVVGEPSELLVHVTRLTDFTPLEEGSVRVLLSSGEGLEEERFEAAEPSRPGLFRVPVKPQLAGARTLRVQVEAPGLSVAHRLGEQPVHPDPAAAGARPAAPSAEGGVFLSKEQQWQSDFATARVQVRRLRGSVPATGVLRASADGEAHVTAPSAGRLTAAPRGFPYAGLAVAGGEVLAYVVPALGGETDLAGLELALGRAESSLELARQERVRAEGLLARQAIPERRVAEARSAEHLAQAERDTAARRLAQVTGGPGAGEGVGIAVRAPLGGAVVQVHVAPGSHVERGERLFHLVDRARLWLEARIAESDLPSIRHPTGAWFRVQGVDESFEVGGDGASRLVAFAGMVEPESRTVPIVFELASPREPLRVGMYVSARVYTGEEVETLAVPSGAVVNDAGSEVVYVQRGGERFERRAVRTGLRDGEQVAILEGLAAGERVVSRGAYRMHLAAGAPADAGHGHRH
jgi:RND family efflux transporter MFP subunit